jgi:hypothetical protein
MTRLVALVAVAATLSGCNVYRPADRVVDPAVEAAQARRGVCREADAVLEEIRSSRSPSCGSACSRSAPPPRPSLRCMTR